VLPDLVREIFLKASRAATYPLLTAREEWQ